MMERLSVGRIIQAYALVLASPLLLLAPLLARGQVLFWGTPALQFVPWWVTAWESLRQGSLPLWNPLNGMGAPLLANYQLAVFYPPNWLLLLLAALGGDKNAAAFVAVGYTFLAVAHLSLAGLGMALLLRRLGFPWLGQVIGGLAYCLSGYIVGRLGFFSMTWVAAWLPWVIYFASRIACPGYGAPAGERARLSLQPGLVLSLAMQLLAGHAQLTWYSILLALAWVTVGALFPGSDPGLRQARWKPARLFWVWMSFGAAVMLAAGVAAIQLVPTFEYLRLSQRSDAVGYTEVMAYSFWPWRLITLFAPDFFGSPARGDFWGYASYWEDHLYAGMVPLLLALSSLYLLIKDSARHRCARNQELLIFLWLGLLVTWVLAMGRYTPVFPFLYRSVPTFALFQAPARYLIWAAFAIPILAATAVSRWRSPTGRGLYWFRLATAGAFAVTLGAGLASLFMQNIRLTFIRATALAGLWGLGFGLLTLAIPYADRRGLKKTWQAVVVVWTLADLLVTGWSLNPGVSPSFYSGESPAAAQILQVAGDQRVFLSKREEYDLKFQRFLRFKDFRPLEDWRALRTTLIPNLNLLDRIPSANNFDPLASGRYTRWMAEIETLDPTTQYSWLALMGVGAVEHIDGTTSNGVRYDPVPGAQRWRWFACAKPAQGSEDAWNMLFQRMEGKPEEAWQPLVLEGAPVGGQAGCSTEGNTAASQVVVQKIQDRSNLLSLRVSSPIAGWLMIADTWYPGWQVRVDSSTSPLYPANYLFRAVFVPAGEHQVVMEYRPFGFIFGALFSILTLLLILYLSIIRGRNSK